MSAPVKQLPLNPKIIYLIADQASDLTYLY